MRIALFVHCFYPNHIFGTEAYTLAIAKNLIDFGHNVTVVSNIFFGEEKQPNIIEQYNFEGIPVISIDLNRFPAASIEESYYRADIKLIHKHILQFVQPDIVHITHLMGHTASLIETCDDLKIPTFATMTDFFGFCYNNKLETANNTLCDGPNADKSNCVACYAKQADLGLGDPAFTNPAGQRLVASRLGYLKYCLDLDNNNWPEIITHLQRRPSKLLQLYNKYRSVIAPSTFLAEAYKLNGLSAPVYMSTFGIDIDRSPKMRTPNRTPLRIGFIGQIAPHKGLHILLDALSNIPTGRFDLRIWGSKSQDTKYISDITAKIAAVNASMEGTFKAKDTRLILDQIDILVIPSTWYENSPLILLQALASHTPCIVSDVQGMTQFITEGVSGYSFTRGDASSLSKVLMRFIDEPSLLDVMIDNTNYHKSSREMAGELLEMYRQCGVT